MTTLLPKKLRDAKFVHHTIKALLVATLGS